MEFEDYVLAATLGTLVVLGAAFPLLVASAVAWWPGRRPTYKLAFVGIAAIIVFGVAGLLSLLTLPFELFGTYISPQLEHDGNKTLPKVVNWIMTAITWLSYAMVAVASIFVPIALRRRLWDSLCEVVGRRRAPE